MIDTVSENFGRSSLSILNHREQMETAANICHRIMVLADSSDDDRQ